jgi:hypothetical protein
MQVCSMHVWRSCCCCCCCCSCCRQPADCLLMLQWPLTSNSDSRGSLASCCCSPKHATTTACCPGHCGRSQLRHPPARIASSASAWRAAMLALADVCCGEEACVRCRLAARRSPVGHTCRMQGSSHSGTGQGIEAITTRARCNMSIVSSKRACPGIVRSNPCSLLCAISARKRYTGVLFMLQYVDVKCVMRCCCPAGNMASSVNIHPVSSSCLWFCHRPKPTAMK